MDAGMSSQGGSQFRNTYESEAQRLQAEADNFTKKFEHAKKKLMVLEDSYKQAFEEMEEKKERLKVVRPSSAKMRGDNHLIKTYENQLDKALVKYSDLQAQNKKLRGEIDVMRKQQKKQN